MGPKGTERTATKQEDGATVPASARGWGRPTAWAAANVGPQIDEWSRSRMTKDARDKQEGNHQSEELPLVLRKSATTFMGIAVGPSTGLAGQIVASGTLSKMANTAGQLVDRSLKYMGELPPRLAAQLPTVVREAMKKIQAAVLAARITSARGHGKFIFRTPECGGVKIVA